MGGIQVSPRGDKSSWGWATLQPLSRRSFCRTSQSGWTEHYTQQSTEGFGCRPQDQIFQTVSLYLFSAPPLHPNSTHPLICPVQVWIPALPVGWEPWQVCRALLKRGITCVSPILPGRKPTTASAQLPQYLDQYCINNLTTIQHSTSCIVSKLFIFVLDKRCSNIKIFN